MKSLKPKRIYIIPTAQGAVITICSITIVMIGAIYSSSVVFLFAFMVFAFGFLAMISTHNQFRKTNFYLPTCDGFFAGQAGEIQLKMVSPAAATYQFQIEKLPVQKIFVEGVSQIRLALSFETRGIHMVKKLRIGTSSPARLYYAWAVFDVNLEIPVFPAPIGNTALNYTHSTQGSTTPTGEEFSSHREMRSEDQLNRIDWPLYARSSKYFVREFSSLAPQQVEIALDQILLPDIESKLQQMSKWIVDLDREKRMFSMRLAQRTFKTSTGYKHRISCLQALARYPQP